MFPSIRQKFKTLSKLFFFYFFFLKVLKPEKVIFTTKKVLTLNQVETNNLRSKHKHSSHCSKMGLKFEIGENLQRLESFTA